MYWPASRTPYAHFPGFLHGAGSGSRSRPSRVVPPHTSGGRGSPRAPRFATPLCFCQTRPSQCVGGRPYTRQSRAQAGFLKRRLLLVVGDCKAHYHPVDPTARRATTEPSAGWCQAGRVLSPRPAEEGAVRGGAEVRPGSRRAGCARLSPGSSLPPESRGSPRPPSPGPVGPWVSMATAGARPGGGQPGWGRGAPGVSAAAWQCSPPWPPCSPSRCPPRCRGETRVKYLRAALRPCPWSVSSRPPSARAPRRVLRARTNFCSRSCSSCL